MEMPSRPPLTSQQIWRRHDAAEQRLSAPLSERMLQLARLRPGMRVLDLASGRGEPAIAAAHRVAPGGSVLGIDLDAGVLAMARERADREGIGNLELRTLDAAALGDEPPFDAVLARWGLMYFAAPVAALAAARRLMVPAAVLVAAVWAEPERVAYHTLPRRLLARHRPLPPIDPEAPGTFRYAEVPRLHRDFAAAGLRITAIEEMQLDVMEAATDGELLQWVRDFGLERLLHDLPAATQRQWEEDLLQAVAPLRRDGRVRLGGVTRIVVAEAASLPQERR